MSIPPEQIRKDLEELIARLLTLSIDTYENLMNILIEFVKKISPVPLVIPQIVIPEHLKKKSTEEAAKIFANLILAPLSPDKLVKIIREVINYVEQLKTRYGNL